MIKLQHHFGTIRNYHIGPLLWNDNAGWLQDLGEQYWSNTTSYVGLIFAWLISDSSISISFVPNTHYIIQARNVYD